LAEDVHKRD
jgi:hypothetical protein